MDMVQIRERRAAAEQKIFAAVQEAVGEFQDNTGETVTGVHVRTVFSELVGGKRRLVVANVSLDIEI